MNEEQNDTEERVASRPKGYTIVRYAEGWSSFIVFGIGIFIQIYIELVSKDAFLGVMRGLVGEMLWLCYILRFIPFVILWVIARKITEVTVNLRITKDGLEQTRLSGSWFFPKYRLIKWDKMLVYHSYGYSRGPDFYISVENGLDYRLYIPLHPLFEKQEDNLDNMEAFRKAFSSGARKHNVGEYSRLFL